MREVWPHLSSDEKRLFDVIARAYLAALMPDFRYRKIQMSFFSRLGIDNEFELSATGKSPPASHPLGFCRYMSRIRATIWRDVRHTDRLQRPQCAVMERLRDLRDGRERGCLWLELIV